MVLAKYLNLMFSYMTFINNYGLVHVMKMSLDSGSQSLRFNCTLYNYSSSSSLGTSLFTYLLN